MRLISSFVVALALYGSAAGQAPTGAARAADDEAVRAVVRRYVEAREARDPKAVAALFTADADQLVSSGEWRQGRDNVVSGTIASSAQGGGTRTIDVERVRFVSKEVAVADGRYSITGLAAGDRRMWSTFVMVKEADGWRSQPSATCCRRRRWRRRSDSGRVRRYAPGRSNQMPEKRTRVATGKANTTGRSSRPCRRPATPTGS